MSLAIDPAVLLRAADALEEDAERLRKQQAAPAPEDYEAWVKAMFPAYATAPMAEHHHDLWRWVWSIKEDERPPAFVGIWNRGGAKSTSAEMACVALGARRIRKYGLYVSRTQDQADDHIQNIANMLESATIESSYPDLSEKLVGKFGNSKGWRRNRLRTASGFTIDAIGLDVARRGVKLEENRPDFIVLDDLDDSEDSPKVTRKLIRLLTKGIIPAGADNVAVLAIQNLIHSNGIFARLANGSADYLRRRVTSGPIPALRNFAYKLLADGTYKIVSGIPTWLGFDVERCQNLLNLIGPKAFREECQHEVDRVEGAFWTKEMIDATRVAPEQVPDLERVVVGVDPSGGDGPENDEQGIVVVGLGVDGHAYVLADLSCKLKPRGWGTRAIQAYQSFNADLIVGERNFGGDMVEATVRSIEATINYDDVSASRGKVQRFEPVSALYGDPDRPDEWHMGRVHHVGSFTDLEEEQTQWELNCGWSPNRLDGLAWALTALMLGDRSVGEAEIVSTQSITKGIMDEAW